MAGPAHSEGRTVLSLACGAEPPATASVRTVPQPPTIRCAPLLPRRLARRSSDGSLSLTAHFLTPASATVKPQICGDTPSRDERTEGCDRRSRRCSDTTSIEGQPPGDAQGAPQRVAASHGCRSASRHIPRPRRNRSGLTHCGLGARGATRGRWRSGRRRCGWFEEDVVSAFHFALLGRQRVRLRAARTSDRSRTRSLTSSNPVARSSGATTW
jgi:hypothetical protein